MSTRDFPGVTSALYKSLHLQTSDLPTDISFHHPLNERSARYLIRKFFIWASNTEGSTCRHVADVGPYLLSALSLDGFLCPVGNGVNISKLSRYGNVTSCFGL